MPTYSLDINDFTCETYTLIGIHTPLSDYKLAYFLNKHLEISFCKADYKLDFKDKENKSCFDVYEYSDTKLEYDWFLIANVYKTLRTNQTISLFEESFVKTYLIPEKKNVDYFIKITGSLSDTNVLNTIEKIKNIPQIATSYTINTDTLKSKDNLIF